MELPEIDALAVRDLKKRFGATQAVDGLTFSVRRGACFGLLGPNGAGKSTTIQLIAGLLEPDAGSVSIGELGAPTLARARARVGLAPQSLAIYPDLTVEENLAFFGHLYGLSGRLLAERIAHGLALATLDARRRERAGRLSGGMQRRLNLACAVVHRPLVCLLDEPTAGVDPQSRNHILDAVERLRREGMTFLYSTHYMEEAERVCDRIAIVDGGRVLDEGTAKELISRHGGPRRVRVEVSGGDLEAAFLNLTGRRLRDA